MRITRTALFVLSAALVIAGAAAAVYVLSVFMFTFSWG